MPKNKTPIYRELIESYINGNKNHVKEEAKKLTKLERKALFMYTIKEMTMDDTSLFFLSII